MILLTSLVSLDATFLPPGFQGFHLGPTVRTIACTFAVFQAVICGYLAYFLYRRKKAKIARSQRLPGEVVELRRPSGGDAYPIIRFQTPSGEEAVFMCPIQKPRWPFKPGDRVEVLFDPLAGEKPEIVMFEIQWVFPMILATSSLGGVVVFFMFLNYVK